MYCDDERSMYMKKREIEMKEILLLSKEYNIYNKE
jgi:hypothetical protein